MEQISYVFSFIATILGLCEPFGKKMKYILTLNFLGNLLVALSYVLVGSINGCAICSVACIQVMINYLYDKKGVKLPKWLVIVHLVSFITVNIATFVAWYDFFALIASIIFVLSVAQTSAKFYRLYYITNSLTWILYDLFSKSYGNLFTHSILSVSIFIAIFIRDFKQQKLN